MSSKINIFKICTLQDAADPYSSIEDFKVDDNEGPDDAPSGKKKHLPGIYA